MRYFSRHKEVRVFLMTEDNIDSVEDWPDWVLEAWNAPLGEYSLWRDENGLLYLGMEFIDGELQGLVEIGDWIVETKEGCLVAHGQEEFEKLYAAENVPHPR